jgi:hypothetical protein
MKPPLTLASNPVIGLNGREAEIQFSTITLGRTYIPPVTNTPVPPAYIAPPYL